MKGLGFVTVSISSQQRTRHVVQTETQLHVAVIPLEHHLRSRGHKDSRERFLFSYSATVHFVDKRVANAARERIQLVKFCHFSEKLIIFSAGHLGRARGVTAGKFGDPGEGTRETSTAVEDRKGGPAGCAASPLLDSRFRRKGGGGVPARAAVTDGFEFRLFSMVRDDALRCVVVYCRPHKSAEHAGAANPVSSQCADATSDFRPIGALCALSVGTLWKKPCPSVERRAPASSLVAPIVKWCTEVWLANTHPQQVRGPIGAAWLSLLRLSWTWPSPLPTSRRPSPQQRQLCPSRCLLRRCVASF